MRDLGKNPISVVSLCKQIHLKLFKLGRNNYRIAPGLSQHCPLIGDASLNCFTESYFVAGENCPKMILELLHSSR